MYLDLDQQLLIYIRVEKMLEKSKVVKTIEINFVLLNKRNELVISASTGFTLNDIDESIIHIAPKINN